MNAVHCRCGGVLLQGGCISCGAGVSTRIAPAHRGPRKAPKHTHQWGYAGTTFEHGTRERREVCTKPLRKDARGKPVACTATRFTEA